MNTIKQDGILKRHQRITDEMTLVDSTVLNEYILALEKRIDHDIRLIPWQCMDKEWGIVDALCGQQCSSCKNKFK